MNLRFHPNCSRYLRKYVELAFSSCVHASFHHHVQSMPRDDMDAGRNFQCFDATEQLELLGFILEIWSNMEQQMFEC